MPGNECVIYPAYPNGRDHTLKYPYYYDVKNRAIPRLTPAFHLVYLSMEVLINVWKDHFN